MPFTFLHCNCKDRWKWKIIFLFPIYLVFFPILSYSQNTDLAERHYPIVEVRPGDHCIVSGKPLGSDDICLLVDGRRVPMKKEALNIFLDNKEKYFSKFQPKSALFTEDTKNTKALSMIWFFMGIYVIIGLIFAAITSHTAVTKGFKPIPWFFAGFLLNAFGYLFIITKQSITPEKVPEGLKKIPLTLAPTICQHCGNGNHPSATNCSNCGSMLDPLVKSEIERLKTD